MLRCKGFVKLHRKFTEWEWYSDINVRLTFMQLLLTANYKPSRFRGYDVPAGSIVTGIYSLSDAVGITQQQLRTALNKLKSTNEITVKATNKFTIIHIEKWAEYQVEQQTDNKQSTNNQQTDNKQITTSKECKKGRREESKNKSASINYNSFPSLPKKQLLDDWLKVRRTKRAASTQTAFDSVGRELHKAVENGYSVDDCFQAMAEKSWAGFKVQWMDNINNNDQINDSESNRPEYKVLT